MLEGDLQSQKAELDDLKEDMLKKNLDVASVDKTLAEVGVKLEEAIPPAPDMDVEIDFVVEQFTGYIVAVQEWGAWFGPALATLENCKEPYKNRRSLEDMNDKLQVSPKSSLSCFKLCDSDWKIPILIIFVYQRLNFFESSPRSFDDSKAASKI